jgi:aryl-alcohol dehydrogenase-like predicted oxidoreductase
MTVLKRTLGKSGIEVSALGLGCWAIGGPFWSGDTAVGWGKIDDKESIRSIHTGLDLGVNFLDTADVYGVGHSERVLAQALGGKRDKVVLATKFGNLFDESTGQITGRDASPGHIRKACEASLKRLSTDYIDLYHFHLNGYDLDKAGDVRETLEDLVKEGKIRYYGWSTDFPDRARFFAEGEHCVSVQFQENAIEDNAPMVALCEELGLAGINRGPLAMGLLTGKYKAGSQLPDDDVRGGNSPDWLQYFKKGEPNPVWLKKMEAIREILTTNGRTLAQGALAWIWGRSTRLIPIPGFKNISQVEQNAGALEFGPLTKDQMEEVEKLLER